MEKKKGRSTPSAINGQLRPPLKWAGGKRWLVPHLRPIWSRHSHRRLVEPFCGGLAVALGLNPECALLNDINPHTANFYCWLQRGLRIRIPMRNERAMFYAHRADFNRLIAGRWQASKKAAELFYYLNRTGYNGLCRFNSKGEFNVPFGQHRRINYRRDFTEYQSKLAAYRFEQTDFAELPLNEEDFVYADPPYDVEFRQYTSTGFDWSEQVRLAEWLATHPGPTLVSNQATDRIVKLYRRLGFRLRFLKGPRMISRTGDRTPAPEVLAVRGIPRLPRMLGTVASTSVASDAM